MSRTLIRFTLAMLLSGALSTGVMYFWFVSEFESGNPEQQAKTVIIDRGLGVRDIARKLEEAELIDDPRIFVLGHKFLADPAPLRAGEFLIPSAISPRGIINILQRGSFVLHPITVAEGLTSHEVVQLLRGEDKLTGEIAAVPAEGTLLPETYKFHRGDSRSAVLQRMQRDLTATLDELWLTRAEGLPLDSPDEALVLASIVEKETAVAEERPRVAAVFINRLRKGMRLQSDPTVIYGVTQGQGPLGRPISRADLRAENDYNTYVIRGLPPTPIANPGRDSIAAVLQPLQTDEFYFVADGTGGHAFAKTLDEHNRNVRAWRKIQRERGER